MKTISHGNIKRFLAAAGVALALPLTAAAFSGPHGGHHGCGDSAAHGAPGMGGGMMPLHLRGLNLSEPQRDKIFEIMHAQAPAMRDKAKAWRNAEDELRAPAMAEMTLTRAKAERQLFEVLTREQRKQLAEMKPAGEPPRGRGDGPRGIGGDDSTPPPAR